MTKDETLKLRQKKYYKLEGGTTIKNKLIAALLTITFPFYIIPLGIVCLVYWPIWALYDAMLDLVEDWQA